MSRSNMPAEQHEPYDLEMRLRIDAELTDRSCAFIRLQATSPIRWSRLRHGPQKKTREVLTRLTLTGLKPRALGD